MLKSDTFITHCNTSVITFIKIAEFFSKIRELSKGFVCVNLEKKLLNNLKVYRGAWRYPTCLGHTFQTSNNT